MIDARIRTHLHPQARTKTHANVHTNTLTQSINPSTRQSTPHVNHLSPSAHARPRPTRGRISVVVGVGAAGAAHVSARAAVERRGVGGVRAVGVGASACVDV